MAFPTGSGNYSAPLPASGGAPAATRRRRSGRGADVTRLYQIHPGEVWSFLKAQSAAFWLVCVYVFFEYVRPQEIYEPLSGMPIPSWVIILCGIAFLLEGARVRKWSLGDTLLAVFSGIIVASSVTAVFPSKSYDEFSLFFTWVLIYILITNIVNTEGRLLVFMLLYFLFNLKMTQHGVRGWMESGFGFRTWGVSCAPSWFHNSGECGIQMSMLFPVSLYFLLALRPFWKKQMVWLFALIPASAVITIIASSSRGAVLALMAVALWMMTRSRKKVRAFASVAVLAVVVAVLLPEQQKDRFREMGDDKNSVARLTYWEHGIEILNANPVLGIGYRNWLPYYRSQYNFEGELPHNIFVEAGAELGYVGLFGFLALIVGTFVMNARTRRLARSMGQRGLFLNGLAYGLDGALIGYMISGFFVTVLYYPFFWINLSMTVALNSIAQAKAAQEKKAMRRAKRARVNAPVMDAPVVGPPLTLLD